MVETRIEPGEFIKALLSHGVGDSQAREMMLELSRNNDVIDDWTFVLRLSGMGLSVFQIIAIARKIGLPGEKALRILEHEEKRRLGGLADTIEVIL